jgi:uncharacterized protein (DUF2141 family)
MQGHWRKLTGGLCILALSACASAPPKPPPPRPVGTGQLQVTITGFESEKGQVLIALFLDERGWPGDQTLAFRTSVMPIQGLQAVARFEDVPAGPFAVSAFHDEDRDRKLDTGLLGIPSEDYGFSRDARGTFGPPSFEAARLDMVAGESQQITIKVN